MALKNKKSLGQNWLKDRQILDYIAELAYFGAETTVNTDKIPNCLEIGPGLGTLTSALLRVFPRVTAVEYDEDLAEKLPKSFPGKDLTVIKANFLDYDLESIDSPYVVAGNIPYYITSPIIEKLLSAKNRPERIVLLVQKEVAERISAKKGDHTFLSLSVQNLADVTLGPVVTREYFTPPPEVDSQIILLKPHPEVVPPEVIKFIKTGFAFPRKKLTKNLPYSKEALEKTLGGLGFSPTVRPADLGLSDWKKLYFAIANY